MLKKSKTKQKTTPSPPPPPPPTPQKISQNNKSRRLVEKIVLGWVYELKFILSQTIHKG